MDKINLSKGKSINLTKRYSGETKYRVGLSWDLKNGKDADLDALVLGIQENGKILNIDYVIGYPSGDPDRDNYKNITFTTESGATGFKDPEGAVKHFGDARSATVSEGDDEVIEIDLSKVNPKISKLLIIASIYNDGLTFKEVGFPSISVYKGDSDVSDLSYSLDESFPDSSVVEVASIERSGGSWNIEALGNGSSDLAEELRKYGIPC